MMHGGQRSAKLLEAAPLARSRTQRQVDRLTQLAGEVPALAPQRRKVGAEAAGTLRRGPAPDGIQARQGLVDHKRERVQVSACADLPPLGLLGRHVGQRPDDVAGEGERIPAHQARDSEVGQLRDLRRGERPLGHEDVRRLDVAMNDAVGVGVGERVAERDPDPDDVAIG